MRNYRIQFDKKLVLHVFEVHLKSVSLTHREMESFVRFQDNIHERLERCPYGSDKNTCMHCRFSCFPKEEGRKLRKLILRNLPLMLLIYPSTTLKYLKLNIQAYFINAKR